MTDPKRYSMNKDSMGDTFLDEDSKGQWIHDPDGKIPVEIFSDIIDEFFNPVPKHKAWRSEEYRNHIRSYPCASCGCKAPSMCAHESLHNTGWDMKAPDWSSIPLCMKCHGLEHSGHGMKKIEKLEAMIKCMADWIENTENKI